MDRGSAPVQVTGHSPIFFSADDGADIRVGEGKALAWPHSEPFNFTGKISKVTIELKPTAAAIEADSLSAHRCEAVSAD